MSRLMRLRIVFLLIRSLDGDRGTYVLAFVASMQECQQRKTKKMVLATKNHMIC